QALPAAGTYQLQLDPDGANVGSVSITVGAVARDVIARLKPGTALPLAIAAAGQRATLTFSGKAGERVLVAWSGSTIGGYTTVTLLSPAGSQVFQNGFSGDKGWLEPQTLPASGRYQLQLDPAGANTGSLSVLLSSVPPDK